MRKLLLALLCLAAPAFGASVTLSNGAACEYSTITALPSGAVSVTCGGTVTPAPLPPAPPAPPGPPPANNPYPGLNMWVYPNGRLPTGNLPAGGVAKGGFTVPPGWNGTVEIGISGANLKVYVDFEEYLGPYRPSVGSHVIAVKAVNGSANGSIDLYHSP